MKASKCISSTYPEDEDGVAISRDSVTIEVGIEGDEIVRLEKIYHSAFLHTGCKSEHRIDLLQEMRDGEANK